MTPSSGGTKKVDYYLAVFAETDGGANMSVTADYPYTKVAILPNQWIPAAAAGNDPSLLTAAIDLLDATNGMLDQAADPLKEGEATAQLVFDEAKKEALANGGIYVPFYLQSEAGTKVMGLILLRLDLSKGALERIWAEFYWPKQEADENKRVVDAVVNTGEDKDK